MYALFVSVWGTYYKLSLISICHSTFTISTVLCISRSKRAAMRCCRYVLSCPYCMFLCITYICPAPRSVQCIVSLSSMGCGTCLNTGGLCTFWCGSSSQEIGVL